MNRTIFVLCLLTAFFVASCANGIHSKTGGGRLSASPTPAEISSSAQVVKINTTFMPRSSSTFGDVALVISPGFHINANPATFPYLIATELQPGKADGISIGE